MTKHSAIRIPQPAMEQLYRLTIALGATLGEEREATAFMDWLVEAVDPELAALFLADEPRQMLRLMGAHGFEPPAEPGLPLGLDPWGWLAGQGVILPAAEEERRYAVPLLAENQLLGTLCLVSRRPANELAEEQWLVQTAAGYLAPVLRNIHRYQTLEQRVAERTAALSALNAVAATVSQSLDLRETLAAALDVTLEATGFETGGIALWNEKEQRLERLASRGVEPEVAEVFVRPPRAGGHRERLLRHGQPVFHDDTAHDPTVNPEIARAGFTISGMVPLVHQGRVLGLLAVATRAPRRWTEESKSLLTAVGQQVAVAVANAQLYEETQQSEEKYRRLVNTTNDLIFTIDVEGNILFANPAAKAFTGDEPEETIGHHFSEYVHPDDVPILLAGIQQALRGEPLESVRGVGQPIEYRMTKRDGQIVWVQTRAWPIRDAQGRIVGFSGISRDITERRQAEEALRESEERFRRLAENAQDLIYRYEFTPQRGFAYVSPAATAITGYTPEDHYADPDLGLKIVHPDDRPLLEQYFQGGGVFRQPIVLRWVKKDGTWIWTEQRNVPTYDEAGNLVALEGIARDVTERKQAEEALRLRMEQLTALSQASQAVTASLELDQVLAEIVSLASKVAASDYVSVALMDEAGHMSQSAENLPGIPSLEYRVRDEGFTSWIARSHQAVIIDEIGDDGAVSPDPGEGAPRTANPHLVEAGIKSFASLPLVAKDRLLGILYLHSLRPRAFQGQLPLLTAFANQVAIALENARLFEETKRRAAETTALLETSLALNSLDLDSTLRTIGERAKALFAADGCRIFLLEPDGETLRCALALHQRAEAVLAMRPRLGQGVTGDIAQRGEAEIVNDMLGDPRSIQVPGTPVEQEAMMFAPLKERERVIGVMSVSRLENERPFRPADLELLKAFASMASSAISNAHLFQETHRRAAQLAIVNELGRSLAATLDLPTVYRTAYQYVQRLVDCPNFAISLFDTEQQVLTMAFCLSDGVELDLALFPPLSYKPQARSGRSKAIASGQPVIVCDQHRAFRESDQAHTIGEGLEPLSALYVPMIVEGQAIGLLEVQSYQEEAYRQEDIELLGPVANQIGLAIQNARLFGETRRLQEFNQSIVQSMAEGIFIEDADGVCTFANPAAAGMLGYAPEKLLGQHWTAIVTPDQQPIIQAANERRVRGESDRYELELVRKDGGRLSVLVSGSPRFEDSRFVGTLAVFTDITERKRAEEELQQSFKQLRRALEGTINTLVSAIEIRDPYTAGHQRQVTRLACAIAKEMGLPEEQIEGLRMAGLIHDLGKINVPAEILSKPGPLTELEYGLIKMHPQVGYEVLNGAIEFPWPVAQIVLHHHERLDGSGYPQGLSDGKIMLEAKILAVADVVEAMASHRPYRPARGIDKALEEISRNRGVLYDPEVVDACLKLFTEKGFRFE